MNGEQKLAVSLLAQIKQALSAEMLRTVDIAVCPPFVYLPIVAQQLGATSSSSPSVIQLGAQNVAATTNGAFTGEVSAAMLSDLQCQYVIVGHSERRSLFDESDEVVANKIKLLISARIQPIICVGETLAEREAGNVEVVIGRQVNSALEAVRQALAGNVTGSPCFVMAYEPVWAIGTGKTATPEQAQEVHAFIRGLLRLNGLAGDQVQLLYGGSVKASNAASLFGQPDIDGGLIGGAALVAEDFVGICAAASLR